MPLVLTKSADKLNVFPGDIVTYTVVIDNPDNTNAETNIVFTDLIPDGATFIEDSFTIGGAQQIGADPNFGVPIPDIPATGSVTVTYQVRVDEQPAPVQFTNTAQAVSSTLPPGEPPEEPILYFSNPYTVNVAVTDIFKSADKTNASLTEEITYTIIINNRGAVELINPILTDIIPNCLSFVPGSFSIDGVLDPLVDPNNGATLPNILPGQLLNISFRVRVICIPCPPKFVNTATLNYGIETIEQGQIETNTITTNETVTTASTSTFKQLSREEYVKIPCQKPDAEEILNVLVDIDIINTKVIKTPSIKSLEGQNLTGFKLIIEGILNQKVEYIADDKEQSVHAAHFKVPFSTFIVLPETFQEGTVVEVDSKIEDIYFNLVDKRTVFKNITFILIAKFS